MIHEGYFELKIFSFGAANESWNFQICDVFVPITIYLKVNIYNNISLENKKDNENGQLVWKLQELFEKENL